jgi:hypothetical protein
VIRWLAFALLFAQPALAAGLTAPVFVQLKPYLDGQSGTTTATGVEQLPVMAAGYTDQISNMTLEPVGDGSIVHVTVDLNLRTDDITTAPSARFSYMLVAGLPPLDPAYTSWGYTGHFEGLQFAPGGQVSLSGSSALNNSGGSRWYITVSYPNALPVNCEWAHDANPHLLNPCWLSGKTTDSGLRTYQETPFRLRGNLSYLTTWAAVSQWLTAQENTGTVIVTNDPSTPSDHP